MGLWGSLKVFFKKKTAWQSILPAWGVGDPSSNLGSPTLYYLPSSQKLFNATVI